MAEAQDIPEGMESGSEGAVEEIPENTCGACLQQFGNVDEDQGWDYIASIFFEVVFIPAQNCNNLRALHKCLHGGHLDYLFSKGKTDPTNNDD